ncbi:MAG: hypothetical protein IKU26_01960 [Clostridia bacterium]|nr:hypothetical protein [Clostridia bacterium]
MKKKILGIGLLAIAVVCLVFSILCFNMEFKGSGSYESYESYGGDAYTGIQNASAQTANNVRALSYDIAEIGNALTTCVGYGFVVVTLTFVAVGLYYLLGGSTTKKEVVVASAMEMPNNTCQQCGEVTPEGVAFCTKCGTAMCEN